MKQRNLLDNLQVIQEPNSMIEVENLVIGSGPGGSITACLLAEAGKEVLLVEEGPFLLQNSCRAFSYEEIQQKYRNGGITIAIGSPKIAYVEGCCVGGGSEINSGLYHRTPPEILKQWQEKYQIKDFSSSELDPYFELCENDLNVCYSPFDLPKASLKLHEGAQKLNWKSSEIPRWFRYSESVKSDHQKGIRQSMTETFIPRFLKAKGMLLYSTRVLRLHQQGKKWIVEASYKKGDISRAVSIQATNIFVAAGAIHTPALLRRSGIKKNIGNQLKLHATLKIVAEFQDKVNHSHMGVPVHQVKEFAPKYSFGCSISSPPFLSLALLEHRDQVVTANNWQNMAIYYAMIAGGNGKVRNIPFSQDPLVRYSLSLNDLQNLSDAIRDICRLLLSAGAKNIFPQIQGNPIIKNLNDLIHIRSPISRKNSNLMTIHLMGSCPMGENESLCAVDSFGKLHGIKGLYIADASLLGGAPGVNPQGTIMALVRRNVVSFLNKD